VGPGAEGNGRAGSRLHRDLPTHGHNAQWGADSRYLSHVGGGGSSTACVFPLEGDVTVCALNRGDFWARAQDWVADVRTSERFVWSDPIIKRLRELGIDRNRIGISSLSGNLRAMEGTISHTQWERLRSAFPNAVFEDVSVMMGELRAVKSPEEVACLERATQITEAGLKAAFEFAHPGVQDNEVHAALYYGMMRAGSEVPTMVIWGTGPAPARDAFVPTHRRLERGDMFANEVEGKWMGYSAQRVQPAFLGDAPSEYLDALEKQRRVFNVALGLMKPGTRFGEMASSVYEAAQELGCEANLIMHGRGRGEDRPALLWTVPDEATGNYVFQEGNCFILKPSIRPRGGPAINWGDTVTVTPQGGRRLGKDEHRIVVIPC